MLKCVITVIAIFHKGPWYGLTLTLNVEQYENVPFSQQDSAIKASLSFTICGVQLVTIRTLLCQELFYHNIMQYSVFA